MEPPASSSVGAKWDGVRGAGGRRRALQRPLPPPQPRGRHHQPPRLHPTEGHALVYTRGEHPGRLHTDVHRSREMQGLCRKHACELRLEMRDTLELRGPRDLGWVYFSLIINSSTSDPQPQSSASQAAEGRPTAQRQEGSCPVAAGGAGRAAASGPRAAGTARAHGALSPAAAPGRVYSCQPGTQPPSPRGLWAPQGNQPSPRSAASPTLTCAEHVQPNTYC